MPTVRALRPPAVVLGLVALGAVIVTGWWVYQVSHQPPVGPGAWWGGAGRLCGLVAGYLGVVQVVLAARVPWFEHTVAMRPARAIHVGTGMAFLTLTAAHAGLAVEANAASIGSPFVAALIGVSVDLPYVWLAVLGLVLLLVTAISSVPALRRTMPYGWWHLQHLAVYPAIVVGFAHQLYGPDLTASPARVLWTGMHLGALGTLGWYRVLAPARLTLRHQFAVAAVEPEAPGVVSILVSGQGLDSVGARSGQYFRLRALRGPMWWHSHPFSLSEAPGSDRLRFTVRAVGDYSEALAGLTPGRWLLLSGPYGALTARAQRRRRVLLLAGGLGIAPLRALLEDVGAGPGGDSATHPDSPAITLLYRTERVEQIVFRKEIDELASRRGAVVHYLTGPTPTGEQDDPLAAQRLTALVPDLAAHDAYVCGPPGMVAATVRALRAAGLDRHHIHAETSAF
ncbi:ferredoxin reductase family protein [Frankia sp. AgKG'84/4]|uniref:ferredoxin reductase family protein n=1 Tax=Frankia sp. AgKG'84/4 TaxID=573490 RepID=UPI00200CC9ED|nr:ferric reductase-like transmembrane domain-containing protein [Frankia sp. AgKG'84/4]MCL9796215.1 ferric reductase-like transmembrane domain-containing protein [Frankia sp. AgKG'84/4]